MASTSSAVHGSGSSVGAGVGAGVYESVESACEKLVKPAGVFEPNRENAAVYARYHRLYQQLYPALKDSWQALAKL